MTNKYLNISFFSYGLFAVSLLLWIGCAARLPADYDLDAWWQAVETGNFEIAEKGLRLGASPDALREDGYDALNLALKLNQIPIAARLITAGADVNKVGPDGLSPLYHAIYYDQPGIVRLLVERKVKVTGRNRFGHDPIQLAALRGYPSVIAELALAGPDIRSNIVNEVEAVVADQNQKEQILDAISITEAMAASNDEESLLQASQYLYVIYNDRENNGMSSLHLVEMHMDEKSPLYSPDAALSIIEDSRLYGATVARRQFLNKWAQSGNSYGQALLGNALIGSSRDNDRPLGRDLMLKSARQGNPLARILINENLDRYVPDFEDAVKALFVPDSEQHEMDTEINDNIDLSGFALSREHFETQLAGLQDLADCGVIHARFLVEQLQNRQLNNYQELGETMAELYYPEMETPLDVAKYYFEITKDSVAGSRWVEKAVSSAITGQQMFDVASFYENGSGEALFPAEKAVEWYMKAAAIGSYDASNRLFEIYSEGQLGVKKDVLEGLNFYRVHSDWNYQEKLEELGPDALAEALAANDIERIKSWLALLGPENVDVLDSWEECLKTGTPELCQLFLDAGIDPAQSLSGLSPLLVSIEHGSTDTVQWLLEMENTSTRPAALSDALVAAVQTDQLDCVELLLKKGGMFPAVNTVRGIGLIRKARIQPDLKLLSLIIENQPEDISVEQIQESMNRLAQEDLAEIELAQWENGMTIVRYDEQGQPLDESARIDNDAPWRCASDTKSGLIWLVKDKTDGIHGHNMAFNFPTEQAQSCSTEACDPVAYRDLSRSQAVCGIDNWRIPTHDELETLAYPHMEQAFPAWPGFMQWIVDDRDDSLKLVYASGLMGHKTGGISFGGAYGQVLLVSGQAEELPATSYADYTRFGIE